MDKPRSRIVHRLRPFLFFVAGGVAASDHGVMFSLTAFVTAASTSRFACAMARPRSDPATRFAVLNQMLMNGFFFKQGLDMDLLTTESLRRSLRPSKMAFSA